MVKGRQQKTMLKWTWIDKLH